MKCFVNIYYKLLKKYLKVEKKLGIKVLILLFASSNILAGADMNVMALGMNYHF